MDGSAVSEVVKKNCIYIAQSKQSNTLEQDVLQGMLKSPRSIPPKYFYDERGSLLFDQICETDEYYPTRTEAALLDRNALELVSVARPEHIIEFGSGTSRKTHHLLQACEQQGISCEYFPFDVCEEMLHQVRNDFMEHYQWLDVKPLVGDYTAGLENLHRPNGTCLYVFLGSSIGNFNVEEAKEFIAEVSGCMCSGDTLLLGVDRVKEENVLQRAYNDKQGITGEFNLNLLNVLNSRLNADFDPATFKHKAVYNSDQQRVEMYLISQKGQQINLDVLGESIDLDDGEEILTEVSHKYTHKQAEALLTDAGLHILRHIEPENAWFSLVLASKR